MLACMCSQLTFSSSKWLHLTCTLIANAIRSTYQWHLLDVIKKVTELVHPGQAPVVAMDQPLFTIAKNIQWKWPSVYGESKFVIMFGRLHIELAALKTAGNLLESSGWTGALDCRQVLPHLGKQTRFWKHHTLHEQDVPTRLPLVSCTKHWKRQTKNMWNQPSPTPNPWVWKTGAQFSRKANRCSNCGSLSCSCSSLCSCLSDQSGLATSRCTSSHWRSLYTGFSRLTTITTHGGYQFTSVIWWLCLICIQTYIHNSWRDTSQSRRRVMRFQTWLSTKHMSKIMLLWRMMMELLA